MACRGKRGRPREKDIWDVEGGYMGMKKQKLQEQFEEQSRGENKEGGLFKGVSIFVNGWTNPSADELKRLMMTHDGVFHHYYNSRSTTHIIASNLPDVKVRALKGNETIVKPEWITDSIAQGKLLDYSSYLLYTHQNRHQPKISFKSVQATSTSNEAVTNPTSKSSDKSSPNKWLAKDATDSRFLGEFFSNSRLHHIATMGANAKDYVGEVRSRHSGTFAARENLKEIHNTVEFVDKSIMHIDMDCFFVSVGLRDRPELTGKPVVVTHAKGNKASKGVEEDSAAAERRKAELMKYQERLDSRVGVKIDGERSSVNWKLENIDGTSSMSEIASCSYEARAKGIKNGMFLGPALKLCPDLVPIPYDFPGYESVSRVLYDTVASYTLDIQAVSCDEMFVDLTSLCKDNLIDPLLFVRRLRKEIKMKTGCNCSVGLGPNILLSRLATKKAKPDGEYLVTMTAAQDMVGELNVTDLPGVGRSLERKLSGIGVATVQQLLGISLSRLQQEMGTKTGHQLYNMARGKDDRKLELEHVRKTISAEVNYGIRFTTWEEAEHFLDQLSEEVSKRMLRLQLVGRSVTLKLMIRADDAPEETAKFNGHGVCDNISKSVQLHSATNSKDIINKEVVTLMKSSNVSPKDMRGIGITVSKLEQGRSAQASINNSILKFVQKEVKKVEAEKEKIHPPKSKPYNVEVVDPEFLASLPADIRAEVEGEAGIKQKSRNPFSIEKPSEENQPLEPINLDPEVLDPDILNQLPPDIKAEVEARFKGAPAIKSKDLCEPIASNPEEQTNSRIISPKKLDPAFLDELPPDIRAEIEEEFSNRKANESESSKSTPVKKAIDYPEDDESSCDISFSQVDHAVLAELPADMQAELRKQYSYSLAKKNRNNKKVQPRTAFDAIMQTSPGKARVSPIKRANSKRGRKKGWSKSTRVQSPNKPDRIFESDLRNAENTGVDVDVLNALPDDIRAEVEAQMKNTVSTSTNFKDEVVLPKTSKPSSKALISRALFEDSKPEPESEPEPEKEKIIAVETTESSSDKENHKGDNLFCGKTTVNEIRPLLKEWIASSPEPLEDDIVMLSDFLKDLIENWKIDLVQVLLKCLFRNIAKLKSDHSWQEAWKNLVQKVQTVMIQTYGNPLFISESF